MATYKKEFILSGGIGLSADRLFIVSATNSTTISTGSLILSGGAGIAQSLSIGGSLQIFNGSNFTAFKASSASNNIYTLPNQYPAIGTSVLQSNTSGEMTWAPMIASSSSGNTTQNIAINTAGSANVFHPVLLTPLALSAGSAVSADTTITFNPSTEILYVSGLAITAQTASTNSSSGALIVTGGVGIGGSLFVAGDLTINGTTTTINTVTVTVDDKNIELGSVATPSDVTAEGGGITLRGATDKSINWYTGTGWSSSESWNLASGNTYKINNTTVLSSNTLGTGIIFSSIQTAGIITSGTWSATAITALYGGTGLVPSFAVGDILYANTASTWGRLTANSNAGYVLISAGSGATPTYVAQSTLSVGLATTATYAHQSGYAITSESSNTSGFATTASYAHQSGYAITSGSASFANTATYAHQSGYAITSGSSNISGFATTAGYSHQAGYAITSESSNTSGFATTAGYAYQSGYGITSGFATTSGYAYQAGYAITSGSSNTAGFATTANYAYQSGYGITSGFATTAGYSHQAGYAITSESSNTSGFATTANYAYQSGYGITSGFATTSGYSHQAGYAITSGSSNTSGFATTASYAYQSGYGITSGLATTAGYAYQSGYGITSGFATTAGYAYQSGYGITSGFANTAGYAYQSGYGITSGFATTAGYAHQSGYATTSGFATTAANINLVNASADSAHPILFSPLASGSGVAVSSDSTISYNPSTNILSTSGLAVTANTASTNSSSGALIVSGGVGIGGSVFIDGNVKINFTNHTAFNVADIFTIYGVNNFEGANIKSNYSYAFNVQDKSSNNRFTIDVGNNKTILSGGSFSHELRIYNVNQASYTGFVSASSGTITYTLPGGDGSANNLLSTNGSGVLSWVNISGLALTNINGLTASYQYLAYDYSGTRPSWTSSGSTHTLSIPIAGTGATGLVSTQTQSFAGAKTFTNDVFISSSTASTWAANGALRIQGGLGVSGQLSFNQAALGFTGAVSPSIAFIGGTTGTPITMTVLSDNSLIFEGTSGKLFGINNNLSFGWIFNVGDISGLPLLRANADGTVAMAEFAGNVGIGLSNPAYKLHVNSSVGFTASTASTNTTTGALIVTGGVGIGQSVSVGGRLQLFNSANFTAFVSSATGNTVYTLPATSPATGSSVLQSTAAGVMSWVPMTGSGNTAQNIVVNTAGNVNVFHPILFTPSSLSAGSAVSSDSTISFNPSTEILHVSGLAVTSTTSSTSSSTGALVVSGGMGVSGDVFVAANAGSKLSVMQSDGDEGGEIFLNKPVTNTTITNGVTIDIFRNRLRFFEQGGSARGFYLDITSGGSSVGTNIMGGSSSGTVNSGTENHAAFYPASSNAVSSNANLQFTGTGISIGGNITATSTTSGSLRVNGGVGITGSFYAAEAINLGTNTFTKNYAGDINLDNGTADTPGVRYYWQNNRNFGHDVYYSGSGSTRWRVVRELGESGGAELFSIDREGTVYINNPGSGVVALRHTGSGSAFYTFPNTAPAIGTSYLVSNADGVMSWIRPKRSYVLSFGAGFTPSANAADSIQLNIPYAPDNVALNYIVKRVEYRNETVSGGTGLSFYIERHTGGDALWSTAHRIHAGSGASFEVGALVNQISFTTINSSAGTNGLVASGDYVRLYFTTVGSAANVSISLTIEEQ